MQDPSIDWSTSWEGLKDDRYTPGAFIDALKGILSLGNDAALAEELGVSRGTISRIRNRTRPFGAAIMVRIQEACGLPIAQLRAMMGGVSPSAAAKYWKQAEQGARQRELARRIDLARECIELRAEGASVLSIRKAERPLRVLIGAHEGSATLTIALANRGKSSALVLPEQKSVDQIGPPKSAQLLKLACASLPLFDGLGPCEGAALDRKALIGRLELIATATTLSGALRRIRTERRLNVNAGDEANGKKCREVP